LITVQFSEYLLLLY